MHLSNGTRVTAIAKYLVIESHDSLFLLNAGLLCLYLVGSLHLIDSLLLLFIVHDVLVLLELHLQVDTLLLAVDFDPHVDHDDLAIAEL